MVSGRSARQKDLGPDDFEFHRRPPSMHPATRKVVPDTHGSVHQRSPVPSDVTGTLDRTGGMPPGGTQGRGSLNGIKKLRLPLFPRRGMTRSTILSHLADHH